METKKSFIAKFEGMRNLAELRVLSKMTLERPPTEEEFNRMMELRKLVFKQ